MEQDKKPDMQELKDEELTKVTGGETIDVRLHYDDLSFNRSEYGSAHTCPLCGKTSDHAMLVMWTYYLPDGHQRFVAFVWCSNCFGMDILRERII